jgi:hypothetical protein
MNNDATMRMEFRDSILLFRDEPGIVLYISLE